MVPPDPHLRNPLDDLVGYRLRRASARLMGELARELADLGLNPTEASVLLLIAANPRMTQSEIGRMLGIQRANMAPLTKALDKRGLICRVRVDGRSHGLAITEQSDGLCVSARAAMERHDARFFASLPERARADLLDSLARLAGETD